MVSISEIKEHFDKVEKNNVRCGNLLAYTINNSVVMHVGKSTKIKNPQKKSYAILGIEPLREVKEEDYRYILELFNNHEEIDLEDYDFREYTDKELEKTRNSFDISSET